MDSSISNNADCTKSFCEKREARTVIDARSRLLISNLRDYFAKERDLLSPAYSPENPIGRTACALKIRPETVLAIIKGKMTGQQNSDTDSNCEEEKDDKTIGFPDTDCFKMEAIRKVIHSLMLNSEPITSLKLRRALKKSGISIRSREINSVLSRTGFYFKECLQAKILFERNDFIAKRCKFLRTMSHVNLKKVIWIGEACIYSTCINKIPYSRKRGSISKGGRVILLHAGGYNGWVQGAERIIISKKTNDYREDIGTEHFHKWFELLLKLIPNQSIIVMENNICHSVEVDKSPKEHNSREDILDWLGRHNVWFDQDGQNLSKAELLGLVGETESFYPTYTANEVAAQLGHTVIHLPPEHSHFNPIERIYQHVVTVVDKRADSMGGLSLSDLESQAHRAISSITQKAWAEAVTQCSQTITKYWANEPKLQDGVEALLQNILKQKKGGRVSITKEGNIENFIISDEESDTEYHSTTHTKRIKITDPDPIEMEKILRKEEMKQNKLFSGEIARHKTFNKKLRKHISKHSLHSIHPILETDGNAPKTEISNKSEHLKEVGPNVNNLTHNNIPNITNYVYQIVPSTISLVCKTTDVPNESTDNCVQSPKNYKVIYSETLLNKRSIVQSNDMTPTPLNRIQPLIIRKQFDLLPKSFSIEKRTIKTPKSFKTDIKELSNETGNNFTKCPPEEDEIYDYDEEATVGPSEVVTDVPDILPSDDMGLFQIYIASDDSLSDVPDLDLN